MSNFTMFHVKTTVLIVCFCSFCSAQTDFKKEILGTWEMISKTTINSENIASDPFMKQDIVLTFVNEEVIQFTIDTFLLEANYKLQDQKLSIGERSYNLLKISRDSLFFVDTSSTPKISYIYKRVSKSE